MENNEKVSFSERVVVRSIASWHTGCPKVLTAGDITIPPKGVLQIPRDELIALGQKGNKLICGIDGRGGHATWYIEDEFVNDMLGFNDSENKRRLVTQDEIRKVFELKTMDAFKRNIESMIKTRAEAEILMATIKALKINDYNKISFCEEWTTLRMNKAGR